MDLYLVRHAIAEPRRVGPAGGDARRPLTEDGAKLFRRAARGLRVLGVHVDGVLTSSYARAWSTAEILHADADWPAPEGCRELEPDVSSAECLEVVGRRSERSLALVGHQPQLSMLASLLISGNADRMALELKKGGVVCVRVGRALAPGAGVLRWSASPKMLRQLGR